ncbi:MAG TPA: tetratricopeptide repeat protein [Kiritimatiellia bacterium]|nr:tetratricopeptide repeat protein [Kiritimatiellia bacterium]HNS80272.1 tetratricopeptide repeat protein [Kiritimatiellia bacterium]
MNSTSAPSWTKLLLVLSFAALACTGIRTVSNDAVWTHLAAGKAGLVKTDTLSFTREGEDWINATWLYDRILNAVWSDSNPWLAVLIHVALVIAAFLLLLPAAREWGGPVSISLSLLLSTWLLAPRFEVSPALAGVFFAALFIALLEKERSLWVLPAALIPAQILWTNMQEGFLIGPALCMVYTVEAFQFDAATRAARGKNPPVVLAAMTVILLAATLINPSGLRLHGAVIASWTSAAAAFTGTWISPFNAPAQSITRHLVTLAMLTGAAGLLMQRKKLPTALTTAAVFSAFVLIFFRLKLDSFIWFALLAFPFFCLSLSAVGESFGGFLERRKNANPAALQARTGIVALLLVLFTIFQFITNRFYNAEQSCSRFGFGVEQDVFPSQALAVIGRAGFPAKAVNMVRDGAYLAYHLPERKVFTDGRGDLYGAAFYQALNLALRGDAEQWEALLAKWDPEALILNMCDPSASSITHHLLMTGKWMLAYFDGTTAIFATPASGLHEKIAEEGLQAEGLKSIDRAFAGDENGGGLIRRPVSARLAGAGQLFLNMRRYPQAEAVYERLTKSVPDFAQAWYNLGISQLSQEHADKAAKSFDRVVRLQRKNALAWLWLSLAHAVLGNQAEARYAFTKGKRLNSTLAASFGDPLATGDSTEKP